MSIFDILKRLGNPSDFRGDPVGHMSNQLSHAFLAVGGTTIIAASFNIIGWHAALAYAAGYLVLKELLIDLRRGASPRDIAEDTLLSACGACSAGMLVDGQTWPAVAFWAVTLLLAIYGAGRRADD